MVDERASWPFEFEGRDYEVRVVEVSGGAGLAVFGAGEMLIGPMVLSPDLVQGGAVLAQFWISRIQAGDKDFGSLTGVDDR